MSLVVNIDKSTKRLIALNIFLLTSLVSAGVIHAVLQNLITTEHALVVGLGLGFITVFYFSRFYGVLKKHKWVTEDE